MQPRDEKFENIREIVSLLNSSTGLPAVLNRIVSGVCRNTIWSSSAIMAVDRDAGISEQLALYDPIYSGAIPLPTQWTLSISASLRAVEENRPLIIKAPDDGAFPELQRDNRILGIQTSVMLPLGATDDRGRETTLAVHSRASVEVTEEEISFLLTLAHLAAIAINKEKKVQYERSLSSGLRRAFEIGASLIEQELVHGSLDVVMQRVQMVMKHPFVVIDHRTGELLAHGSPVPTQLSNASWSSFAAANLVEFFGALSKVAHGSGFEEVTTVTLPLAEPVSLTVVIEPLHLDTQVVGSVIVFPPENGMESSDRVIAQAVRFAINVQFLRDYFLSREESGSLTELFGSLLDGTFESQQDALARGRRLGIDLQQPARLLALNVELGKLDPGVLAALSTIPGSLTFRIAIAFKENLLLAYIPEFERGRAIFEIAVKELIRRISASIRKPLTYTTSEVCHSISEFALAFAQCHRVLMLARRFGSVGFVREGDLGAFPLLLASADLAPTKSFVNTVLRPVEIYDRENSTDLIGTIRAFVDSGRKYQSTARTLGIHLSTVRYRIGRVKEVFGVDLDDSEVAFNFALAFRIRALAGLHS